MKGKIRVFCRVRPLNDYELSINSKTIINIADPYTIKYETPKICKNFI